MTAGRRGAESSDPRSARPAVHQSEKPERSHWALPLGESRDGAGTGPGLWLWVLLLGWSWDGAGPFGCGSCCWDRAGAGARTGGCPASSSPGKAPVLPATPHHIPGRCAHQVLCIQARTSPAVVEPAVSLQLRVVWACGTHDTHGSPLLVPCAPALSSSSSLPFCSPARHLASGRQQLGCFPVLGACLGLGTSKCSWAHIWGPLLFPERDGCHSLPCGWHLLSSLSWGRGGLV